MKVYITRWALTEGIIECDGQVRKSGTYSFVMTEDYFDEFVLNKDAFLTRKAAKQKAEEMRDKRIEPLKKQIQKLEKMKF